MLKIRLLEDLTGADAASCAGAAVTAAGTWWSLLGDAAVQLLGVPLPVALAAATGAFLARTYQDAQPLWKAFAGSASWVVGACALAPLAGPITEKLAQKFAGIELQLPAGALAGMAFAIALAGPFALQHGIAYLKRKFGAPLDSAPASSTPGATGATSDSKGTP
jgi:hypothetical protein